MNEEKKTKEEEIKEKSNYLHGSIKEELLKSTSNFNPDNAKILKFHGIYQQDNRDSRQERTEKKLEKEFIFMIRTKLPGGQLTPEQYLGLDEISDKYANKTLRITTRQTIQFHGVIKGNLHKTLNEINKNLINTYGACGDVVRNVMACPICDIDLNHSVNLGVIAREISDKFLPNTKAYYEIWINEEKIKLQNQEIEPMYGKFYLPRKFKIGIALPDDNCIDVFTQDVGLVAILNDKDTTKVPGYNLLVGGGLGHTHNKPNTYPRLASELGFIKTEHLLKTLEGIILIQKDFGSRTDRKHARMKYLIDDKGLAWFKEELESRIGIKLQNPRAGIKYIFHDHLGWNKQKDANWYVGIFIENGRICDSGNTLIKTGLKEIVKRFNVNIRTTPNQNIILTDIKSNDKSDIEQLLHKYGFYFLSRNLSPLRRFSMACPALPTCGLALAEAERTLPSLINNLEKLGYDKEALSIRMSGCPNSCSRPPMAELGIIGMSANKYNIYVGGSMEGTRLNKLYKCDVPEENLVNEISKLFNIFRANYTQNERFGDFCNRVGIETLKTFAP